MKHINRKKIDTIVEEVLSDTIKNHKQPLMEMATCGVEKWGKRIYKIAVHGASSKDRPTPHIHIYLNTDNNPYSQFNFEISFVDFICNDTIVPIYQLDRENNLKCTNRRNCSWNGYKEIEEGLRALLSQSCSASKFGNFSSNLERVIYEWNRETDFVKTNNGGNPLKEYLDSHNLVPHPKYQHLFQ